MLNSRAEQGSVISKSVMAVRLCWFGGRYLDIWEVVEAVSDCYIFHYVDLHGRCQDACMEIETIRASGSLGERVGHARIIRTQVRNTSLMHTVVKDGNMW
jgi:hypothetical protein